MKRPIIECPLKGGSLHNPNFPPNHSIYISSLHFSQVFPHELLLFIRMYSESWFTYAKYIIPRINPPPFDEKVYNVLEYLSRKVTTQRHSYIFNPIATHNREITKACDFFESPQFKIALFNETLFL